MPRPTEKVRFHEVADDKSQIHVIALLPTKSTDLWEFHHHFINKTICGLRVTLSNPEISTFTAEDIAARALKEPRNAYCAKCVGNAIASDLFQEKK